MSKRGSWFSGFLGQSPQTSMVDTEEDAKERAARLTREADIRRLYEAGTQQEVLEQLYKAEEVEACIQKYKEEKDLLSLLDGSEKTEPENDTTNNKEQGEPSSQNASGDENKEGLGQINTTSKGPKETGTGKMHTNFTLRLDDSSSGIQLDASITDVQRDRTLDRSLDDTNLLMDSVHINESSTRSHTRGTGRETNKAGAAPDNSRHGEPPEPEDDLLKELLNPDLDESSQYEDDSVTTHDDDALPGSHSQTPTSGDKTSDAETNATNNKQKVTIDASAILGHQQGSSDSNGNSQQAQESVDNNEQLGGSLSSKEGGTSEVKNDHRNESSASEADSPRDEDKSENGKDDEEEASMNTEEPMAITEELEAEETMDAESEELGVSDDGDRGDTMDDQEENHMETTSVEDDEELSEEEIEEGKRPNGDEEMDETVLSQAPDTMDTADEVEEVMMNVGESGVSMGSASDDGAESDSSSGDIPLPPPPSDLFDVTGSTEIEEEIVEDEEIEEEVVDDDEHGVVEEEVSEGEEDHEEEVVEDEHEEEEEVVSVSDQGSEYGEQVVESWQDVIEEEPEDLEAAVTALIAVVYRGEDVDVERMLRRSRLPDLYKYLKQEYWYKIHTSKEETLAAEAQAAASMKQQASTEILTVDDMLKGRLEGMIANVQHNHMQQGSSSGRAEEDGASLDESAQVTKHYVIKVKSQGAKGEGRHVSQDYAQAVNNRTQVVTTARPNEEQLPARATKKDRVIEKPSILTEIENAKKGISSSGQNEDGTIKEAIIDGNEVVEEHVVEVVEEEILDTADESHCEEEILEEEQDGVVEEEILDEDGDDHVEEEILEEDGDDGDEEVIEDEEESVVEEEEEISEEEGETEEHVVEDEEGEYEDEVVEDDGEDYEDEVVE